MNPMNCNDVAYVYGSQLCALNLTPCPVVYQDGICVKERMNESLEHFKQTIRKINNEVEEC